VSFAPVVVRDVNVGDEQEFMLLLEPLLPTAHRLALGLLRSPSDAEDAVQSALLNAWRHFGQFRRGSDLKPWLLTIVANECRRQRRNRWWSVVKSAGLAGGADRRRVPPIRRSPTCAGRFTACPTTSDSL